MMRPFSYGRITGYDKADRNDLEDTDAGPNDVITANYRASQEAYSEELRLQSADASSRAFWVGGLYYAHEQLDTNSYLDVLRVFRPFFVAPDNPDGFSPENSVGVFGYPYEQTTESWAAFGQIDYNLTPKLTGTLGLRYSHDSKDFNYTSNAEFGVWGRNLFDETNISDIIPIEGLGFDLFSMGPPRTAGVYARYNY